MQFNDQIFNFKSLKSWLDVKVGNSNIFRFTRAQLFIEVLEWKAEFCSSQIEKPQGSYFGLEKKGPLVWLT